MRSLFKSNKSQNSLSSPGDSPVQQPSYQYPPPPAHDSTGTSQYDGTPDNLEEQLYQTFDDTQQQSHPAHLLTRSESKRLSVGHDVYQAQRPGINVSAPLTTQSHPNIIHEHPEVYPPPPAIQQQQPVRVEKEQKKSKRSIFGLHSSSSKDNSSSIQVPSKALGRTPSVVRKHPGPPDQHASIPRYPQVQTSNERPQSSTEHVPLPTADTSSPITEQYYRQQSQPNQAENNHFDSPQSQASHQSPQYLEDVPAQYSSQPPQYKAFHPPPPKATSDIYLPYQTHPERPSLNTNDPTLRPPSQQSLGPPSPILSTQQAADSRPSTSTTQSRYSVQSLPPQTQQQGGMVRGDGPPNAGMRGPAAPHMNTQHGQSRGDAPAMDSGHGQYGPHSGGPLMGPRSQVSQQTSSMSEQGRNTPPLLSRNRDDLASLDYQGLLQKHEELQAKYSKVKKYYFEKDAQVTQLQNTVANQRLSMSKTSLDDNEYATRFNRLDGAINNLSFNIRKFWKGVPPWLSQSVNKDAHTVGTKEMTAVGRACITRWVVDEIFDRFFHPSIEPGLSSQLKIIEKNIRRNTQLSAIQSEEQRDDQTTKLTNWRLVTMEGLQESINGPQATDFRVQLTLGLIEKLTASLQMNLTEPPPPGLDSGVGMIIELAVGILVHLPNESRDVCVEYFMPGSPINDSYMKIEPGLPPLTNPGVNPMANDYLGDQADRASTTSGLSAGDENASLHNQAIENEIRDSAAKATAPPGRSDSVSGASGQNKAGVEKKKQSFLGGLVNKKMAPTSDPGGVAQNRLGGPTAVGAGGSVGAKEAAERERDAQERAAAQTERDKEGAIRFAAFVSVDVRGRGKDGGGNVLVRATCFGF